MKTNRLYRFAALILGVSVLATGCIKETLPMNGAATSGQIESDPEMELRSKSAAMHTSLISTTITGGDYDFGLPSLFAAFDRAIGEVLPSNAYSGGNQYYDRFQFYAYQMSIGPTGACTLVWHSYYTFIKAANDVLLLCGDDEDKAETRGIAKTFRASHYLDLARMYDALPAETDATDYTAALANVQELTVPIVREGASEASTRNNPRAKRDEMFQFIFDDLNDAEACLAGVAADSKNIPSLAVVYGLKARAYLWLGGFEEGLYDKSVYPDVVTGDEAYKKAAEYARKAINESGCTPLTEIQYCDPITGFNKVNNAWLWGMIQSNETVLSNLHAWAAHMSCNAGWAYGSGAQPGVRKATYDRMSNSDFRKKIIVGPDTSYANYKKVTNLTEKEWSTFGLEGAGMRTYAHLKFRSGQGEKINSSVGNVVDIPLMRVEEMYFIEAEATAQYNVAAGTQLIKDFMTQYRDPKYTISRTADIIEEIIFQKRVELWGEGILFYDFKRLNIGLDNAYAGNNTPAGLTFSTNGRCPAWNICIPIAEEQQNVALKGKNNPDPSNTIMAM
ncbi:MAG: RagB/SusD family nutrient uptake outer membrane protein [Alistipes sp.]|nr:RagB/SusD family nutrient uptake outer membrane protein [Alistipes sp.]